MVILQNTNRTMLVIKLLNSPKLGYIEYRHETVMQECLKLAKCFFCCKQKYFHVFFQNFTILKVLLNFRAYINGQKLNTCLVHK